MKLFFLLAAVVLFILVAILAFVGGVTLAHLFGFGCIGLGCFAASFLPIR